MQCYQGKRLAKKCSKKPQQGRRRHLTRKERERRRLQRLTGAALVAVLVGVPVGCQWWSGFPAAHIMPILEDSTRVVSEGSEASGTEQLATHVDTTTGTIELTLQEEEVRAETRAALSTSVTRDICWNGRLLTPESFSEFPVILERAGTYCNYVCSSGETLTEVLAKTVTQEIGGLKPKEAYSSVEAEWAAVVWCILNRAGRASLTTPEAVEDIVKAPNQFAYYADKVPFEGIEEVCVDVLCRWVCEDVVTDMVGEASGVGRTLPSDYLWFLGDGTHNNYRNKYSDGEVWQWVYADPYI
jgi:hypothetical protein